MFLLIVYVTYWRLIAWASPSNNSLQIWKRKNKLKATNSSRANFPNDLINEIDCLRLLSVILFNLKFTVHLKVEHLILIPEHEFHLL